MSLRPAGASGESALQCQSPGDCYGVLDQLEDTVNQIKKLSHSMDDDLKNQACELRSIEDAAFVLSRLVAPFTFGLSLAVGAAVSQSSCNEAQLRHRRENEASMNKIYDNLFKFKKGIRQIQRLVNYLQHHFPRFGLDSSALLQMDSQIDKVVDAINDFSDRKRLPDVVKQCYEGIKFLNKKVIEVEAIILQAIARRGEAFLNTDSYSGNTTGPQMVFTFLFLLMSCLLFYLIMTHNSGGHEPFRR